MKQTGFEQESKQFTVIPFLKWYSVKGNFSSRATIHLSKVWSLNMSDVLFIHDLILDLGLLSIFLIDLTSLILLDST